MKEQKFFQEALSDFTYEAACGGAIRHLTDLGCTVAQIVSRLDFPVSYERVQRAAWQRLVDTEVILLEEPGSGRRKKRAVYVREYDQYGKASFRRMWEEDAPGGASGFGKADMEGGREGAAGDGALICKESPAGNRAIDWKERHVGAGAASSRELALALQAGTEANGKESSYVSCDFGPTALREPQRYQRLLEALEERQREYLTGLPWAGKRVYHRLDSRMTEILLKLYDTGGYHGKCYFLKTQESVIF